MNRLRIVPLDDAVVFPGMAVTLAVDVGSDARVLLLPRKDNTYARVGVVAEVSEHVRLAGRGRAVALMPLHRAIPGGAGAEEEDGALRVDVESRPDQAPAPHVTRTLEREYRAIVDEILELRGDDGRIRAFVRSITEAGALADTAGYSPDLNFTQKLKLLDTFDVVERLELALQFQRERLAELQVRKRIQDDVEDGTQKQQREYFLRRQMEAIRKELGETAARSRTNTVKKSPPPGCPMRSVSRPTASYRVSSAWAIRTPRRPWSEPTSIGCWLSHGRRDRRIASIRCMLGKCSTPTMKVWMT